jgi:signal transduction histidine kinase
MRAAREEGLADRPFCGRARRGTLAPLQLFLVVAALSQPAAALVPEATPVAGTPVRATLASRRVLRLYSDSRLLPANVLFDANLREGCDLPAVQTLAATPIFDGRHLRRWGRSQSQLPPGSSVRFEPPSFWRQHLTLMITTGGVILLQSGLIIALVLQNRRRHWAEGEAQRRREELAHMTRVATMGELTASLAHEINQPLAAILSNAQAGQRLLAAGNTDAQQIAEILADIAADDRRAGEVIRRMRTLLRKGGSEPTTLDVNDLVAEVIGLVRGEMILQNVSLALELSSDPLLVHGDQIQLQQVLLNLVMNALDALKEISGGDRSLVLHTTGPDDRSVLVSVEDSGFGVPTDRLEGIFEPFFTTKPHGMGLGLAICRSIVLAHGGRIGCTNNGGRGATFWFTLPAVERAKA